MTDYIYEIWRTQNCPYLRGITPGHIFSVRTNQTITARTQKEAEYKLIRRYKNAGFHMMGLTVCRAGESVK